MSDVPARELLPPSEGGRRFTARRTVRLSDVDPEGELRLDAIGRYLQDVASDDALGAGLPNALGWVVRRTLIQVTRPASLGDAVELATWCTGSGRSWAERRTSLRSDAGAAVDAVSLWVQVDVATGRPARLGEDFFRIYGPAAAGRQVSSKLSLPGRPPDGAEIDAQWRFRRADLDPFGHVNNAAQLVVLEQHLPAGCRRGTAEIEYLAAADADGAYDVVTAGDLRWLVPGDSPAASSAAVTVMAWRPESAGQAQPSSAGIGVS